MGDDKAAEIRGQVIALWDVALPDTDKAKHLRYHILATPKVSQAFHNALEGIGTVQGVVDALNEGD